MSGQIAKQPYELMTSSKPKPDVKQALRLTLWFLPFYAILALHFRNKCYADPTSYFFRPSIAYAAPHSTDRIKQAEQYADSFTPSPYGTSRAYNETTTTLSDSRSPSTTLCVGIPSVRRPRLSYLKTTLASLHHGIDGNDRQDLTFTVLLAHTNQSEHPDFGKPWLKGMADTLMTYGSENDTTYEVAKLMEHNGSHEVKSKFDYALVLKQCLKTNADYVLMLEDDVIFTSSWWEKTKNALEEVKFRSWEMGYEEFLYLRLFYYERIRGWNSESWPKYLLASTCIASAVLTTLLLFQRLQSPARSFGFFRGSPIRLHIRLHTITILLITFVFTPAVIGLYFAAGANCMLPQPPGVQLMPTYACCGQALVFSRAVVQNHILPLFHDNQWGSTPVDSLIEEYADSRTGNSLEKAKRIGDMRWAITPVLLQHVGSQSSHGVGRDSGYGNMTPSALWNFGFERLERQYI
ncbi:hypothetical protein DM02DRAFT_613482 [Periconia macrospinosa]|uniref:Integral membrane protein n=1 Tax=Periconia macrospinosa TaxID=97972 RepID=A0A2V1DUP3_9PLEO|nr:hypothetical protein DM02DRAFT_613482 [Periconia macrospinosa]